MENCTLKKVTDACNYEVIKKIVGTDYFWNLKEKGNMIICKLIDNDYRSIITQFSIEMSLLKGKDEVIVIEQLIKGLYKQEINWRNKSIILLKNKQVQKTKSLSIWHKRENEAKVGEIVRDIVNLNDDIGRLKNKIRYYKQFIKHLYYVKKEMGY